MAWYLHPSKQLRDDELPPELVVTDRDGSIEQAYVPYNDIERLQAENAKLRRLVRTYRACHDHVDACRGCSELPDCEALEKMRSIGREVGIEVTENE